MKNGNLPAWANAYVQNTITKEIVPAHFDIHSDALTDSEGTAFSDDWELYSSEFEIRYAKRMLLAIVLAIGIISWAVF